MGNNGIWMILGTGDPDYERYLSRMSARHDNLIYLNGYSDAGAHILYAQANLFIMPSSYEPCGLSQMLAMRSGSPCVVHGVGGLRDTVRHRVNGFVFQGETIIEQAENFATTTIEAISMQRESGRQWQEICLQAGRTKFEWAASAERYRNFCMILNYSNLVYHAPRCLRIH